MKRSTGSQLLGELGERGDFEVARVLDSTTHQSLFCRQAVVTVRLRLVASLSCGSRQLQRRAPVAHSTSR